MRRLCPSLCLLLVLTSLAACDDGATGEALDAGDSSLATDATGDDADAAPIRVALVDQTAWQAVAQADDPWAEFRTGMEVCAPPEGWNVVEGLVEVNTTDCNYATLAQPLLAPIAVGDTLDLVAWHGQLFPPDQAAEGHLAVAIDGHTFFEGVVALPHNGTLWFETFTADFAADAGATLQLHVRNHGVNTWNLVSFDRLD